MNSKGEPTVKPVRKDGLETRRRLVDAAEKLLAEQGVEKVKLVDVSREAGQKNRNAAQYHFGDRAGLINAVLDKHTQMIAQQRRAMLDLLEPGLPTMRQLVDALVLPVVDHVKSDPNGLTYLMVNRQLISASGHMALSWQRVNDLPDVLRLQRMMKEAMAAHHKDAMRAKMILVQCMLFNGLANFYDLYPKGLRQVFIDTLCSSINAVLLEGSELGQ
jgi:AcrR family transcriptional regulator